MKVFHKPAGVAAAVCAGAMLAGPFPGSFAAQPLDLAQAPLASASNLSVLPNLLFLLDDSGSMMFDTLPDHTERVQGGAERRYWHRNFNCKPKNVKTTSNSAALRDLLPNHCDRVDPPFGAVQFNGMYYNPQFTYRPPINADGSSFAQQTNWTSVPCDPFGSKWKCSDWYNLEGSYYNSGSLDAEEIAGQVQSYRNPDVKQWYGTGTSFNVQGEWPEVVYCREGATNLDQCRRNGLTGSAVQTGNPFRYTTARWGAGGGGYPEAEPVHEFVRRSSSATVTVSMAYPHGGPSSLRIIPRTGTDLDAGSTPVTATLVAGSSTQFTYTSGANTARTVNGSFDFIVALARTSATDVVVTTPWAHGLIDGDEVSVAETSCSSSPCGFATTSAAVTVLNSTSFRYRTPNTSGLPTGAGYYRKVNLYAVPKLRRSDPFYYTIEPIEYCNSATLVDCVANAVPTTTHRFPAPVRYCSSAYDANRLDTPSGNDATGSKPRCRKKYEEDAGYVYPRYGQFRRVDIVSSGATFSARPLRTDCANRPVCSYGEEMTNFANWFAYYRTRMLMMKSATGVAFGPIDSRYRVGFLTINPQERGRVQADRYLKIDTFTPAHRDAWYQKLYLQEPRGGTPLPQALARAGRHFAGVADGINLGMSDDPVQYSCQQNFTLLTTDGYWSGRGGVDENGKAIGNVDADSAKTPRPVFDGGNPFNPNPSDTEFSSSGTLADVALHYYQTDLRKNGAIGALGTDVSENNVPTGENDGASWQHMVTFGLGMAEGLLDWRPDYESSSATGDYDNVRKGALNACTWTPGACNWPMPGSRKPSNLDDLWHAAVNGRGRFFYANDTRAVQDGLDTALTSLNERSAAGAAAATSTPNITPSDRAIFRTTYRTVQWDGDVTAQFIDPNDGSVLPGIAWSARDRLQGQVGKDTDTRTIYLGDERGALKLFKYDQLDPAEKAWFDNRCQPPSAMSQCAVLDTQLPAANSGANMVAFLRGQSQHEASLYRDREFVLGDTVNAVPLYVARPRFAFSDAVSLPYLTWKEQPSIRNRTPAVYVGANDGQLHAFNVNTGDELWSYIPRRLAPELWKLAEENYATKHRYFVDGSPATMDVWDGSTWRTIVVGGYNAGARGYYALDVTNPNAPIGLWEFCNDKALCPLNNDKDLGYSFGNPIITKRGGAWVVLVTSGYNNGPEPDGDGRGYLYVLDAIRGTLLEKIATGAGTPDKPSGFGRISGWADNFVVDNTARFVVGGDQDGNVWKIDLSVSPARVLRLAQALDASGKPQPITARPELGLIDGKHRVVYVGTGRYLGVSDLTDPATQKPPLDSAWQQSIYAFKDSDTPLGNLRGDGNKLVQQTIIELAGGTQRTASRTAVDWDTQNGWYIDLNPNNQSPGERVSVDMQLVLGTLLAVGNVPGASACAVGGDSWIYQFDYRTGSYVVGAPSNLVARKQTGALTVGLVIYQLQKGAVVGQIQRSEATMRRAEIFIAPSATPSRRISWREITPGMQ